jgi:uncharacterized PurR-regulated membrane protein YhhQ (DUF165 family)
MLTFAIFIYAAAIILANLSVATFGPAVTPINAFVLIGLDLALRNWLSLRMTRASMASMILGTGMVSYLINPASGMIAVASGVAFTVASLADWWTFNTVSGAWLKRNFAGNSVGALVDSVLFPTIAFGALMPVIVVAQFVAKVSGGAVWGYLINKNLRPA